MTRPHARHEGSCHCGAVRFAITTDFPELTTCDCSICRRRNALMVKVHESRFELLAGAEVLMKPGPGGHRGEFTAWDVVAGKELWSIKEMFPVWSGAAVTAGDVVFYGTMDGWFKAVNANSGELLWKFKTSSGVIGQPTTWRGPDGKQYVAVLSGVGGWAGAIVAGALDGRDGTAALGFVNAMRDLPEHTAPGGTLYVFTLPERVVNAGGGGGAD